MEINLILIKKYNLYLASYGTDNNNANHVTTANPDPNDYKVWTIYSNGDGTVLIKNSGTGMYLDGNGVQAYAHKYNGGAYQKWILNNNRIQHSQSKKYLDVDYTGTAVLSDYNYASEFIF